MSANVFLDTEFGGFLPDELQLVSIGFVSETDRSLYLELDEVDPRSCSQFCRDVVLPLLDADQKTARDDAAIRIRDYLGSFGGAVTIWTDHPGYDVFLLRELLANVRGTLPELRICVPEFARFIPRMTYRNHMEALFERKQLRRHHALDDAKAMRAGWIAVRNSAPSEIRMAVEGADPFDRFTVAPPPPSPRDEDG